jgi:GNAT superfamily N-acetyltransferase
MSGSRKICVRAARDEDVPALAALSGQLGYPVGETEMAERLARVRAQRLGEVFVGLLEDEPGVRGWTHVVPRLQLEETPFAELAGLVVAESARGLGVGAALLAAAEGWAREAGFALMRVRSNVVRERAHRFYEREGYCLVKRQAVFHKSI